MRVDACAHAPGSGLGLGWSGEKWGPQFGIALSQLPFVRERERDRFLLEVRERVIANSCDRKGISAACAG